MLYDGITLEQGSKIENATIEGGNDLPVSGNSGQIFIKYNDGLYLYKNSVWEALALKDYVDSEILSLGTNFVSTTGDTMTGFLTLHATPTSNFHASTKEYVDTTNSSKINKSGDTMTGFLTLHATPTNNFHSATKSYVDSVAEGLSIKPSVRAATTGNLAGTYDNGTAGVGSTLNLGQSATLNIDGVTTWALNDGVLVKDQTNAYENGRYYVSQVGDGSTDWILTRCGLCDEPSEVTAMYVFVSLGTENAGTGWVVTGWDEATDVIGTDDQIFTQFSRAEAYTAGTNIDITGSVISAPNTVTKTGDAMSGFLTLHDDPSNNLHAATKQYVDNNITNTTNESGRILQMVSNEHGNFLTGTTIIPFDDTIPQITEGNEFLTISITPKSNNSTLVIEGIVNLGFNGATTLIGCLFLTGENNALDVKGGFVGTGATQVVTLPLSSNYNNTDTNTKIFTIRGGGNKSGTCYNNGSAASRRFGGAYKTSIRITEIAN